MASERSTVLQIRPTIRQYWEESAPFRADVAPLSFPVNFIFHTAYYPAHHLGAPLCPERGVYRAILRDMCTQCNFATDLAAVVRTNPHWFGPFGKTVEVIRCSDV